MEFTLITLLIGTLIAFLPFQPIFSDFPLDPTSHNESPSIASSNWNSLLSSKGEVLFLNRLVGPESLAISNGVIYTGLADGRLMELYPETQEMRFVTRFALPDANDCHDNQYHKLNRCGRPLGLRFNSLGYLLVVDANTGLYQVNVTSGAKKPLIKLPASFTSPNIMYNDFVVDPVDENLVYLSVTSRKWSLASAPWIIADFEDTGLLLGLNVKDGSSVILAHGIHFANGVELSSDSSKILISETSAFRIISVSLEEARSAVKSSSASSGWGKEPSVSLLRKEVFASSLPGEPDNIRMFAKNLYVGFASVRASAKSLPDYLTSFPIIKKVAGRIFYLMSRSIDLIEKHLYSNSRLEEISFNFRSGHLLYDSIPKTAAIAVVDGKDGKLKGLIGSETFAFISEAHVDPVSGYLYYGSFRNRFLGRIKMEDIVFN